MFYVVLCAGRLFHAGLGAISRRKTIRSLNLLIKRCNIVLMLKIAGMTVEPPQRWRLLTN